MPFFNSFVVPPLDGRATSRNLLPNHNASLLYYLVYIYLFLCFVFHHLGTPSPVACPPPPCVFVFSSYLGSSLSRFTLSMVPSWHTPEAFARRLVSTLVSTRTLFACSGTALWSPPFCMPIVRKGLCTLRTWNAHSRAGGFALALSVETWENTRVCI